MRCAADAVVAACDAYDTLRRMLGGRYPHPQLDALLASSPLFPPMALVSFGLTKRFAIPYSMDYQFSDGIACPDTTRYSLQLRSFEFDPSSAPAGASSVMVSLNAPLDYWQALRQSDKAAYRARKQQLADAVAQALEARIPGFCQAVAVTDVCTPATYRRLANLHQASFEGFLPTPAALGTRISKRLPGVSHLYLCGQWTAAGGGICAAINDGKTVARLIGKEVRR